MWIFLIFSVPVSLLLINSMYKGHSLNPRLAGIAAVQGGGVAILGLILFWALRFKQDFIYQSLPLWFYSFIFRGGTFILLGIIASLIYQYFIISTANRFRQYLIQWGMLLFVLNISELFLLNGSEGFFAILLTPLMRLGLLIYFSCFFNLSSQKRGWNPYLYWFLAFLLLFIYIVIEALFYTSFQVLKILLPFLFILPSVYLAYSELKELNQHDES